MSVDILELMEAEALLQDIERDGLHPAMDRCHRNHNQARRAFLELEGKVIAARAILEIEELLGAKLGRKKNKLDGVTFCEK